MNSLSPINKTTDGERIIHSIAFEFGLIATLMPISYLFMSSKSHSVGLIAVALSVFAMLWNYVFNLLFDQCLFNVQGHYTKSPKLRIIHTVLFELGLILITVPILAWSLQVGFIEALLTDLTFVCYAFIYAWGFNLMYDRLRPFQFLKSYLGRKRQ
ncbi:PACE efflux transporter [Vibrio agarivorans]|uniref:PACE efflux transporter n=1 Tax=Vibrio agarivorans TaxID=153622 RepID=A0ABT7XYK5_9VIBR|nr:PACE efflux transporter [Vibrio agarivorans]MDN2480849.1 PACE efflux transporter [Vibrio agarivorans]